MRLLSRSLRGVADEPSTALDVTIQVQVLDLIRDLREETGTAVTPITHDLGVAAKTADRVLVMHAGRKVGEGKAKEIFDTPTHPYTRELMGRCRISAAAARAAEGACAEPYQPSSGCRFHTRCPIALARCLQEEPPLTLDPSGHSTVCHLPAPMR